VCRLATTCRLTRDPSRWTFHFYFNLFPPPFFRPNKRWSPGPLLRTCRFLARSVCTRPPAAPRSGFECGHAHQIPQSRAGGGSRGASEKGENCTEELNTSLSSASDMAGTVGPARVPVNRVASAGPRATSGPLPAGSEP
jgi:hypothetical protein